MLKEWCSRCIKCKPHWIPAFMLTLVDMSKVRYRICTRSRPSGWQCSKYDSTSILTKKFANKISRLGMACLQCKKGLGSLQHVAFTRRYYTNAVRILIPETRTYSFPPHYPSYGWGCFGQRCYSVHDIM